MNKGGTRHGHLSLEGRAVTIYLADAVVTEMRFSVLWKSNLLTLAACLALASTIAGQTPPTAEAPHVLALRVTEAIKIDGGLDEPAWASN
jgi:hypothetical protein